MSNSKPLLVLASLAWLAGCSTEKPTDMTSPAPQAQGVPSPALAAASNSRAGTLGTEGEKASSPRPSPPAKERGPNQGASATAAGRTVAEPAERLKGAAAAPVAPFEGSGWEAMFDGHDLAGWKETAFAGRGEVECQNGLLVLNMGDPLTGINWTNDFPKMNYEVGLDAMRVMGSDFFCGLTVPVGDSFCTLVVGGWGGSLVGISSLDGMDASENETMKYMQFQTGRWYRIRLRVTEKRIEGWIDQEKLIDVVTTGRRISLRLGEIEMSKPFGLATYTTTGALREIKMRRVSR